MDENQNVYNVEQPMYNQPEPKNKSSLPIILLVVVLIGAGLAGGYFLGSKNKENKTNKKDEKKIEISKEKLDELLDNSYYYTIMGEDIVEYGLEEDSKFALVVDKLGKDESKLKSIEISDLYGKDKNVVVETSEDEKVYVLNVEFDEEEYPIYDISYYSYEDVNTVYKSIFNEEAPKKSISGVVKYYYCSAIDGYIEPPLGKGALFVPEPIHVMKDYSVKDNQLTINVYHATYDFDILDAENEKIVITMNKDNSIKYTVTGFENVYKTITDDMLKNHKDKLDVVEFIYTIDGDNYYLKEIKK